MPNIGFKTVTIREEVYEHLQVKAAGAGTTIARFLTKLVLETVTDQEAEKIGDYLNGYTFGSSDPVAHIDTSRTL